MQAETRSVHALCIFCGAWYASEVVATDASANWFGGCQDRVLCRFETAVRAIRIEKIKTAAAALQGVEANP